MYVPCGKCEACRNKRAFNWTKRLEMEMHCWKYTAFVTLTYAPEHRPQMELINDIYVDLSHKHSDPNALSPCCNTLDLVSQLPSEELKRFYTWKGNNPSIPYLSVYDVQCFIKRLRKNSLNYCKKHYEEFSQKDYQIRYYACGEYGSTTCLPHYHLLFFFSSSKEASYFEEIVRQSWQFGIVDFSYAGNSAAHYVASYVNSSSKLSPVYTYCKQIRPFFLCSKCPPIGTLSFSEEEVKQIFDTCSPIFTLPNYKQKTVDNVPLWQTFVYRLYPRLSLFNKFLPQDRIRLYESAQKFLDWSFRSGSYYFVDFMLRSWQEKKIGRYFSQLYYDYIQALAENVGSDLDSLKHSILRWYYVSSRVVTQSYAWNMSVRDYYFKIQTFYENVEKEKLSLMYQFLSDYSDRYNGYAVGFYRDFLDNITSIDLADLSAAEILSLENMNIDLSRLFSDDLEVRLEYISEIHPDNQMEFVNFSIDNQCWSRQMVKTKFKNDYLEANPQLKHKIY